MMMSDSLSRRSLYILFVLSIAGVLLAVVLMALLAGLGYMGFDGNTQVTGTCTGYFLTKYSQTAMIEQLAFIFSILSLTAFTAVLILMIRCIFEANKSEEQDVFIHRCMKISLYVLTSVAIMCAIPPFGYYLSIVAEINSCASASYDSSKVPAILAMAALLLLLLLAFFLLLFFVFCCGSSEEKYHEVSRRHTERNEEVKKAEEVQYLNKKRIEKEEPYKKEPEVYEKRTPQEMEKISPPKRVANRAQDLEQTKQNLYNSPSRLPTINSYIKEAEPRPYQRPAPERLPEPPKEPPPVLQPKSYIKESYPTESPPKYVSPRRPPPENNGELMFHKERTKGFGNDDEEFSREQSRYLNRYADRPILSSGVKEINNRGISDGFLPGELPRKTDSNVPSRVKGGRQGNLVNYIRGKYAN